MQVQLRCDAHELLAIAAGQIGHRGHRPFTPQQMVGKRRDVAHVDARAHHAPALARGRQRGRHQCAHRREQDGRIQRLGRHVGAGAGPGRAEFQREALAFLVAGTREGEHPPAFQACHLRQQVGGGAEAVQAEPAALAGRATGAVADQPGAQQRGGLRIGVAVGNGKAEARIGQCVLGIAAIHGVAGEQRLLAQVLQAAAAVVALPAGAGQPGDADAIADPEFPHAGTDGHHAAHHLMAGDHGMRRGRQLAIHHVQVGAAHAAGGHTHQQRCAFHRRQRDIIQLQGPAGSVQPHGLHRAGKIHPGLLPCGRYGLL